MWSLSGTTRLWKGARTLGYILLETWSEWTFVFKKWGPDVRAILRARTGSIWGWWDRGGSKELRGNMWSNCLGIAWSYTYPFGTNERTSVYGYATYTRVSCPEDLLRTSGPSSCSILRTWQSLMHGVRKNLGECYSTVSSSDLEKAELAGTPIIHKRVVSLLVETELQTRARWKGYWRESSLDGSPNRTNPPGARTRSAKCAISPN